MFQNYTWKAQKILSMDTLSSVWHSTVPKRWLGKWDLQLCTTLLPFSVALQLRSWNRSFHEVKYSLLIGFAGWNCAPNHASNLLNPSVPLRALFFSLNLQLIKHEALTRTRRMELVRFRLCKIVVESFKSLEAKIFLKKCETTLKWYFKFGRFSKIRSLVLKYLSTCSSLSDQGQCSDVTDEFDVVNYSLLWWSKV